MTATPSRVGLSSIQITLAKFNNLKLQPSLRACVAIQTSQIKTKVDVLSQ